MQLKQIFILTGIACVLTAQAADTNTPPVVTVTASSQTADTAAVHDVLRTEPGVVLNSQGGSQNDLSVRGSSFSGAGLSLGGVKLSNPQTEHFHAELPLPAAMLSRPGIRTGLDNQGGHLAGTVGFDLRPITGQNQVEIGFGSHQHNWQSLLLQHMLSDTLGIGIFAGRDSADGLDYSDNESDRRTVGGHLQYHTYDTQVDLLIAHQEKEFGARSYYGIPDTLSADEETEETLLLLSAMKGYLDADYLRAGLAWREFYDDYRIPAWTYENHHRSRTATAFFDGRTFEINGWALGWRLDAEEERIAGAGLGWHHRTRGGISLLPQWRGDRLTVTLGAREEFFTGESPEFLPQLGAEYLLTDNLTAFASYSESVRLPSYTELYYLSPANAGDPTLQPQTAAQTELGLSGIPSEFLDWKLAVFHRRSHNAIDWQKNTPASLTWTATDIGTLDTVGLEADINWYPAQNLDARFTYTWIHKDRKASDFGTYASRYALDYPEHLAQASLLWRPVNALEIGTVQAVRLQTDNAVRRGSNWGFDSSFVVRYTPTRADFATLSLLLNNAWDDTFEPFPGQRPNERYAGLSLTLNW